MVPSKVNSIIVEQVGMDQEDPNPEDSFIDDLGAHPLDTVELVAALEEELDTENPDAVPTSLGRLPLPRLEIPPTEACHLGADAPHVVGGAEDRHQPILVHYLGTSELFMDPLQTYI